MKPFLECVADAYLKNETTNLSNYCFILPNRRSGSFLKMHFLESAGNSALILPEITTISDFIADVCNLVEASRVDLLFTLYNEYARIAETKGSEIASFDQFIFWGDMIINDFNDTDKYLVDAKQLFANVKELKEIKSTFLTEEQRDAIAEYFGPQALPYQDYDNFWTHINDDTNSKVRNSFVKLWEILLPLYNAFNQTLKSQGKAYSGQLYRQALNVVKEMGADDFRYKRYIFVGFNMLSKAEIGIFKSLKDKGIADFYWDMNSSIFFTEANKGSFFIRDYIAQFKSKYIIEDQNDNIPKIEVVSVPSNSGQLACCSEIISNLAKAGEIAATSNAIDTAVVLPDESLFIPMIESVPNCIKNTNITIGYPLKYAAISTLVSALAIMHNRARKERDVWTYFHEDIHNVLIHPYVKALASEKIDRFFVDMRKRNLFTVPEDELCNIDKSISKLFRHITDLNNRKDVIAYINDVIDLAAESVGKGNNKAIELGFIESYRTELSKLEDTLNQYDIDLQGKTFFFLVERTINSTKIAFEGEPLKGLQIMGVLETRCIDFKNLIILSMNERVFPRKHFARSFIPNAIRRANGMSIPEFQESILTYYFYRMLSRAENVYLVYDSRTKGIASGEASRFIKQLTLLFDREKAIVTKMANLNLVPQNNEIFNICKDDRIMELLKRFQLPETDPNARYLSASALKTYLKCPLEFYFKYVEGINVEDEMTDFIDSSTFGTIVHNVMQELYYPGKKGRIMRVSDFDDMLKTPQNAIEKAIADNVRTEYLHKPKDSKDPLTGDALLIADVIKYYVTAIVEYDKSLAEKSKGKCIEFIQAEEKEKGQWDLYGLKFNFKQYIDRIDCIDGQYRIVDYKTGSDEINFTSISSLFELSKSAGYKKSGIFQVILYCHFHNYYSNTDIPFKPVIYTIKTIKDKKPYEITNGNNIVNDYKQIDNNNSGLSFIVLLRNVISDLFDKDKAFQQQQPVQDVCKYCDFKEICKPR